MRGSPGAMVLRVTELRVAYHQRLKDIDAAVKQIITLVEQDIPYAGAALLDADKQARAFPSGYVATSAKSSTPQPRCGGRSARCT